MSSIMAWLLLGITICTHLGMVSADWYYSKFDDPVDFVPEPKFNPNWKVVVKEVQKCFCMGRHEYRPYAEIGTCTVRKEYELLCSRPCCDCGLPLPCCTESLCGKLPQVPHGTYIPGPVGRCYAGKPLKLQGWGKCPEPCCDMGRHIPVCGKEYCKFPPPTTTKKPVVLPPGVSLTNGRPRCCLVYDKDIHQVYTCDPVDCEGPCCHCSIYGTDCCSPELFGACQRRWGTSW